MTENFTKNNFEPFKNKKLFNDEFTFKNMIEELPLIPGMYFKKNDSLGSSIINSYYSIKINLDKLRIIKQFILKILEVSFKNEVINKHISKEKYKLVSNNLIINFGTNISDTFSNQKKFNDFIELYKKEKYNILKNIKKDEPYFFSIFQNEYNGKSKTYFINLFKKYIEIRKQLLSYLSTDYGILAFDFLFNLNEVLDYEKIKVKLTNKINNNKNNENNYIISGNNSNENNGEIKFYRMGNKVQKIGSNTVYKVNSVNYTGEKVEYTIKNTSNTAKTEETVNSNRLKPFSYKSLPKKIHKFDTLYISNLDKEVYKVEHLNCINEKYNNLKSSIDNYVGPGANYNLYDVIVNNFESDFNMIEFIFYYADPVLFNKGIDAHFLIKEFISKKINNFELYYEQYIMWFNTLITGISDFKMQGTEESNFATFFDNIIKKIEPARI